MATKDKFSPQEWQLLLDVPPAVGTAVMHAGNSGAGTIKESYAMVKSILRADAQFRQSKLIRALVEARTKHGESSQIETLNSPYADMAPDQMLRDSVKRCQAAVALLSQRVSSRETEAYVDWTLEVAENVAQAAKEGGFLGIGGERVSPPEEAAIAAIEEALLGPAD